MAILLAQIGEKTKPFFYLPAMLGIEKENLYLSVEQFAEIMSFVKAEADETRAQSPYLCRAIMNEMLLILMAETGLWASGVCNLKLKNLPSYHGKPVIEVECGKGQKTSKSRRLGMVCNTAYWLRESLS